jgi:hypothetical protein
MAQTTEVAALALIQPLHGFTSALLHLTSMRIITATLPFALAGTAHEALTTRKEDAAIAVPMIVASAVLSPVKWRMWVGTRGEFRTTPDWFDVGGP